MHRFQHLARHLYTSHGAGSINRLIRRDQLRKDLVFFLQMWHLVAHIFSMYPKTQRKKQKCATIHLEIISVEI